MQLSCGPALPAKVEEKTLADLASIIADKGGGVLACQYR